MKMLNVTYPKMFQNRVVHALWKKFLCKYGLHLFDEFLSQDENKEWLHYLYCDACELSVEVVYED